MCKNQQCSYNGYEQFLSRYIYASISNPLNKNRPIVKHSTDSTNAASTAEHVPLKQTVNELSRSLSADQQEDNEDVFGSPQEHVRRQRSQDKRQRNTIYGTAKDGKISGGLLSGKTRHLFIYGARKETSDDAIKTLLMENESQCSVQQWYLMNSQHVRHSRHSRRPQGNRMLTFYGIRRNTCPIFHLSR